jgi:hypothetical protein
MYQNFAPTTLILPKFPKTAYSQGVTQGGVVALSSATRSTEPVV